MKWILEKHNSPIPYVFEFVFSTWIILMNDFEIYFAFLTIKNWGDVFEWVCMCTVVLSMVWHETFCDNNFKGGVALVEITRCGKKSVSPHLESISNTVFPIRCSCLKDIKNDKLSSDLWEFSFKSDPYPFIILFATVNYGFVSILLENN